MDETLLDNLQKADTLTIEILYELLRMPPERYPAAYRKLRELNGRNARPGTGPLAVSRGNQSGGGIPDN